MIGSNIAKLSNGDSFLVYTRSDMGGRCTRHLNIYNKYNITDLNGLISSHYLSREVGGGGAMHRLEHRAPPKQLDHAVMLKPQFTINLTDSLNFDDMNCLFTNTMAKPIKMFLADGIPDRDSMSHLIKARSNVTACSVPFADTPHEGEGWKDCP